MKATALASKLIHEPFRAQVPVPTMKRHQVENEKDSKRAKMAAWQTDAKACSQPTNEAISLVMACCLFSSLARWLVVCEKD